MHLIFNYWNRNSLSTVKQYGENQNVFSAIAVKWNCSTAVHNLFSGLSVLLWIYEAWGCSFIICKTFQSPHRQEATLCVEDRSYCEPHSFHEAWHLLWVCVKGKREEIHLFDSRKLHFLGVGVNVGSTQLENIPDVTHKHCVTNLLPLRSFFLHTNMHRATVCSLVVHRVH